MRGEKCASREIVRHILCQILQQRDVGVHSLVPTFAFQTLENPTPCYVFWAFTAGATDPLENYSQNQSNIYSSESSSRFSPCAYVFASKCHLRPSGIFDAKDFSNSYAHSLWLFA